MKLSGVVAALLAALAFSPALAQAGLQTATTRAPLPGGIDLVQASVDPAAAVLTVSVHWPFGVPAAPAAGNMIFVSVAAADGCRWVGDGSTPGDAAVVLTGGASAGGATLGGFTARAAVQEGLGFIAKLPQLAVSPDGDSLTVTVGDPALTRVDPVCYAVRDSWDGPSGSGNIFTVGPFDGLTLTDDQMAQEVAPATPVSVLGYMFPAVGGTSVAQNVAVGNPTTPSGQSQTAPNFNTTPNLGPLDSGPSGTPVGAPGTLLPLRVVFAGAARFSAAHPTIRWLLSCNLACTGQTSFRASVRKDGRLVGIPALDASVRSVALSGAGVQGSFSRVYRGRRLRELRVLVARHGRVRIDVHATVSDGNGHSFRGHRALFVLPAAAHAGG